NVQRLLLARVAGRGSLGGRVGIVRRRLVLRADEIGEEDVARHSEPVPLRADAREVETRPRFVLRPYAVVHFGNERVGAGLVIGLFQTTAVKLDEVRIAYLLGFLQ